MPHPLIEAQSGLWYAQRLAPNNPAFNTAHTLWLTGPLHEETFCQAIEHGTKEAEAFSLRMRDTSTGPSTGPVQWVDPDRFPSLRIVDLSKHEAPEQAARDAMHRERMTPVDPTRDRLVSQVLFRLGPNRYAWYLRAHHLVTDGYAMALFTDRVSAWYSALLQSSEPTGKPLGQLVDVYKDDEQYRASERRERDAEYWRETLSGMNEPAGLKPGFAPAAFECIRRVQDVPKDFQERLLDTSQRIGIPWTDTLTTLIAEYCRRFSGSEEIVVGLPFMGRMGNPSARVPILIMNVLPVRIGPSGERSVGEFVRETAKQLIRCRRHGRYRAEQIRRDLGFIGGQRRLYGPIVNLQPFYRAPCFEGLQVEMEVLSTGPVDDFNIGFRGDAQSMFDLEIEANPSLYSREDVDAHAARLLEFLDCALGAEQIDAPLSRIPLATREERQRYLYDVNATDHPVPATTLVALYESKMKSSPDAPALEFEGKVLTYRELEERTLALALQLQALDVGPDKFVAVALHRSMELVIALLAVQRAGGAYMPLDLEHPDQRIATVLESASPVCVLTDSENAQRFPKEIPLLVPSEWECKSNKSLQRNVRPEHAAYVIYTSGSTGDPKGVVIEHQGIVNRLEWMRTHYAFEPDDRFLQKTPATFDVSVWEFFLPFLTGGTLVVAPPKAHQDPIWLGEIIRDRAISTIHFVPSMLATFLAAPRNRGLKLRRVFCSGEELGAELRDKFHESIDAELHNLYGPTEAAVDVSYWPAGKEDTSRPVPIGFPVWNTRLYILDERMTPVPPGVVGDLYLGGVQLARGYLNRPDLTSERFLEDPFLPGERIYRTGDIAKWREDGAVLFLGRSDHQVKLRGLRIELGEIEAVILRVPGIARAGVIVREDRPGQKRLVAYVQSDSSLDVSSLREHVAALVPDYMVPSAFVFLEQWPVTANGKLDRKGLPAPQLEVEYARAPQTETERGVAALFAEVLQTNSDIGVEADFFALGGDSLSAVHLLLAIQQRWDCEIGLETIFSHPSVGALAKKIDEGPESDSLGFEPIVQLASGDDSLPPLFVIHPAGGICWNYRELANALHPKRNVYGLQSPVLDESQEVPDSIDSLADGYIDRILEVLSKRNGETQFRGTGVSPEGTKSMSGETPVPRLECGGLVGWSVGGIIAQAMAVRLQKREIPVRLVALLDAYPCDCWREEEEPDAVMALRALLAIAGEDPDKHRDLDTRDKVIGFLKKGNSPLGHLSESVLRGVIRAVTSTDRLVREHYHEKFAGRLVHLRAGKDHADRPQLQSSLWAPYAESVEGIELPFVHAEMTGRDASAVIAPILDQHLRTVPK